MGVVPIDSLQQQVQPVGGNIGHVHVLLMGGHTPPQHGQILWLPSLVNLLLLLLILSYPFITLPPLGTLGPCHLLFTPSLPGSRLSLLLRLSLAPSLWGSLLSICLL